MSDIVLAADIGGTKSYLALAERADHGMQLLSVERYANDDFNDFGAVLRGFLKEQAAGRTISRAALGVAGPRDGDRVWLTNRPWLIDATVLSEMLNGAPVRLLNDLEATAQGVELLGSDDVLTLQRGEPIAHAPQVVIGAGTGLGIAYRLWDGTRYRMVGSEGGHMGFAPVDLEQIDLCRTLYERLGRVEAEHVVSGAGIARIYAFLGGPADIDPAQVSRRAFEEQDARALKALAIFASCFGAVAGDHALAMLAYGGVYLVGGIAPKVLQPQQASHLLTAFNSKGGHSGIVERIPVHVVLNEQVALLGAALAALQDVALAPPFALNTTTE